jgi:peptide-methionine (R)-S-oxide reductase
MLNTPITRRRFSLLLAAGSALGLGFAVNGRASADEMFEVTKTEAEWQKLLSPEAFTTLRQEATERPFTSKLLEEHRKGTFNCAGCDLPVYASETKFDSGTGWPSFFDHLPNAIGQKEDNTLFTSRTEVHCRRCGGHLGHVFDDGPKPTGLRYCMNGVALKFVPVAA